jgi:hypothetical protein
MVDAIQSWIMRSGYVQSDGRSEKLAARPWTLYS